MTTGERIAKARKHKNLTQEKLAEILGISPQAVSSWERDEYLPDTKNLIALADALDVTLDSLLREDPGWKLNAVNYNFSHMFTFVKGRAQIYGMLQTLKVLDMLRMAHGNQKRKSKYGFETTYMVHPLTMACHALAMGLKDDNVIAACLAHDMVEDSRDPALKPEDLPVNETVREAVRLVSKNLYDHSKPDWEKTYFAEIRKNPLACLIKCLDRVNNLAGMADAYDRAWMVRYTAETDRYYPDLLEEVKKVPEWNDAWWLMRYQMMSLLESFKRIL